ncbi:MAG: undecaprenyl-phosphate glucose phosphotransferase [Rhodocyclaceae bacterium]
MQIALNAHRASALAVSHLRITTFIEVFLDPAIVVSCLFISAALFDRPLGAQHVILALITLLSTFPGSLQLADSPQRMAGKGAVDWLLVVAALLLFGHVTDSLRYFSTAFIASWTGLTLFSLLLINEGMRRGLPLLMERTHQHSAVVVGCNEAGATLARQFIENAGLGIRFHGFFDDRTADRLESVGERRLLGRTKQLASYVKQHRIEHIYIALPMAAQPRILSLLDDLRDTTASLFFVPDIFMTDLIQGRVDSIAGVPVVTVCETPFAGMRGVTKRLSDIVLASLILVLISPVMLAVAIGVRMGSPGPIIFSQRRYGLDGREITVYKFRSMTVTEDGDRHYTQVKQGDARVTPFGAFIRKTSLDELPQFINVLQGRMSIVGPRPHAIAVNEQYRKLIPGYMVRHKVRPGITGWAQVNGYRGGDDLEHMKMRIRFDLEYLRNWSLPLDLSIILRTVLLVARDSKAY